MPRPASKKTRSKPKVRAKPKKPTRSEKRKSRERKVSKKPAKKKTAKKKPAKNKTTKEATHNISRRPPRPVEPAIGSGESFRSGCVALVGRPNVGKSTILNSFLGQKIAATTHKPQTTRKNILGVLHPPGAQILLLDTPGYHQAKGPLNRYMVAQAEHAIRDADVVGVVVEARADGKITPGNRRLLESVSSSNKKVVLLINKVDLIREKTALLTQINVYQEAVGPQLSAVVPISATKRDGLEEAVRELGAALPEGPKYYEDDRLTDQSESTIVAEFIREKVMLGTREELPYSIAVTIDSFEDGEDIVRVFATIHVERSSQKSIVIGKGGERLKEIGTRARKDIEFLLRTKVYLNLNVRVSDGWSSDSRAMARLGYGGPEETEGLDLHAPDDES